MDYIEGLFLGKLWSDTDFENRKHVNLFILYGLLVDLIVVYGYFTGKLIGFFTDGILLKIVIYAVLFFACPFICFKYYKMPFWGKILVLLEKAYKALLVMSFTVSWIFPRITVQSADLRDFLITYLNNTLEKYTEKFYDTAGTFATVIGVVAGGIHTVFVVVVTAAAAVILPGLVFIALRLLQYGYDKLIERVLIRGLMTGRK